MNISSNCISLSSLYSQSLAQYTAATTIVVMIVTAFVTLMTDTYEDRSIEVFCTHSWCIFGCFSKEWFPTMMLFGFFIGVFCNTGLNYAVSVCCDAYSYMSGILNFYLYRKMFTILLYSALANDPVVC